MLGALADFTGTFITDPTIIADLVRTMRAAARGDLVNYAGAAHRDRIAARVCVEYALSPESSDQTLLARARAHVYGLLHEGRY